MRLRSKRTLAVVCLAVVGALTVVALALTVFPQNSGLSNAPCQDGSGSCVVQITGTITTASQSGAGMLNLTIHNVANNPFASIAVVSISPSLADLVSYAPFSYNGMVVSASNPLPVGSSSNGSYRFSSGGLNGTTYTIAAAVTTTDGQVITEKVAIVASG